MIQLLQSMKVLIKLPVMVRVDNIEAIFMASNMTAICSTKHLDIRYKHVDEYVEDSLVFVNFADNDSNILTKNSGHELHGKHPKKMIGKKLE